MPRRDRSRSPSEPHQPKLQTGGPAGLRTIVLEHDQCIATLAELSKARSGWSSQRHDILEKGRPYYGEKDKNHTELSVEDFPALKAAIVETHRRLGQPEPD